MTKVGPIHPVILCGGSGTRLWPVSLPTRPKPFIPLIGNTTLFEQTIARTARDPAFADPIIVAGSAHVSFIEEQMYGAPHRLVVEPAARNTAPAIALAALLLDPGDIMLVCPSDHHIGNGNAFRDAARSAAELARGDRLVAFGIAPDRPETGYGYLKRGAAMPGGFAIDRFVEKPDLARARDYCESGEYSWNGGIFAFRAGALLEELARYRPAMVEAVRAAMSERREEGTRMLPGAAAFERVAGESIDYAVMENTRAAAMVPVDMAWSDIGSWRALHDVLQTEPPEDANGDTGSGNVVRGRADLAQCRNVLAQTDSLPISAVGLSDVCIVVANGEVLVTTREGAQGVGKLPRAKGR